MRRFVGMLVVVALAAGATSAGAAPQRTCGKVKVGSHKYLVVAHGVSCKFAKKWVAKRLKKGHKAAPGYRCRKASRGSNVKVSCTGRTKPKGDQQYRFYYGILQ